MERSYWIPSARSEPELCRDDCRRRTAPAMATARSSSTFSRLLSASSAKTELDRAIRPSNTKHSSSAIDETTSITSSDGSSCSKLLRKGRDSVLPIRPRASAADVTTLRSRSSRRSIKIEINSGNGRAQRQASARIPGSACRNSPRKASGDSSEPRRAAALTAICNVGPCTTARSIISETACAASRPPIMARPSNAAACSETARRVPNPAKRRHRVASAGTAAESRRRPASAARMQLSARLDPGIAAINSSSSISDGTRQWPMIREEPCKTPTPTSEKRSSCRSGICA
jgi:hypothetical protein